MEELLQLEGVVETIIYQNDENGYTVLSLSHEGGETTVVGSLPLVSVGEEITVMGHWTEHKTYGPQFVAESYEKRLPVTSNAILRYLSSGAVKGIGKVTAARIVELFGDDSLSVIEDEPWKLTRIKGISPSKAELMSASFKSQFGIRNIILFLQQYEISTTSAMRIWKRWGFDAVDRIKANPYILYENIPGIGFAKADAIACSLGMDEKSSARIEAAVNYVLTENSYNGHTFLPKQQLISVCATAINVDEDEVENILSEMTAATKIVNRMIGKVDAVFLSRYFNQESRCAAKLMQMTHCISDRPIGDRSIDSIERRLNIEFNEMQRQAIVQASLGGIMVLTGGPGTGKTTVVSGIIRLYEMQGKNFALVAPTGRAAKRISELSGYEAKTVHRLLEMQYSDDGVCVFGRDMKNPLDFDAVICDESSMIDITLMDSLLQALPARCSLILVGDNDQLPPVGPGNPFGNIIQSGKVPVVALTEIFRQAANSRIVTNAHGILKGEPLILNDKSGDFFFINTESGSKCLDTVVDLCTRRLPSTYGWNIGTDIQVITPSKLGSLGTANLNKRLKSAVNPDTDTAKSATVGGRVFSVGDKVMQVKNNYDIVYENDDGTSGVGVFNGDIGIVKAIDKKAEVLYIYYDDRLASYPFALADDLELAYAITAHKSQGSEFECVVLVLYDTPAALLYRNLLYTAITRAKKMLVIVGDYGKVENMLSNISKRSRFSGLKYLLLESGEE